MLGNEASPDVDRHAHFPVAAVRLTQPLTASCAAVPLLAGAQLESQVPAEELIEVRMSVAPVIALLPLLNHRICRQICRHQLFMPA